MSLSSAIWGAGYFAPFFLERVIEQKCAEFVKSDYVISEFRHPKKKLQFISQKRLYNFFLSGFCLQHHHYEKKMLATGIASTSRRILPRTLWRNTVPISTTIKRQTPLRFYATSSSPEADREKAKDRAAIGPFNARAAGLFVVTGIGLFFYFRSEKQAVEERKRQDTAQAKVGRPKIGGEFEMIMPSPASLSAPAKDVKGRRVTEADIHGSFSLIYFGFCNCPDICVDILDIIGEVLEKVDGKYGPVINPFFFTCDPARDTLPALSVYTSEFHPRMIGLTGSYDAVKQACKAYRVYFSTPPGADPSGDYLVDHSVFVFLMDPDGKFVEAFGRSSGVEEITAKVSGFIEQWKAAGNLIQPANAKARILQDDSRLVE